MRSGWLQIVYNARISDNVKHIASRGKQRGKQEFYEIAMKSRMNFDYPGGCLRYDRASESAPFEISSKFHCLFNFIKKGYEKLIIMHIHIFYCSGDDYHDTTT